MRKPFVITFAVLLAVVAALGAVKVFQIKAAMAQGAAWAPPPEAVTTVTASAAYWASSTGAIGSVAAVQGVTVSADLPGTVAAVEFESGRRVRAGDVLLRLDTRQEQAQL